MRLSKGKHVIAVDQDTAEAVCSCGWDALGERADVVDAAWGHVTGRPVKPNPVDSAELST